jgi:hypothetical protein
MGMGSRVILGEEKMKEVKTHSAPQKRQQLLQDSLITGRVKEEEAGEPLRLPPFSPLSTIKAPRCLSWGQILQLFFLCVCV